MRLRNQVVWRLANCRVAVMACASASSFADPALPPGRSGAAGPAAWRPAARDQDVLSARASARPPSSTMASKRAAMRARNSGRGRSRTNFASRRFFRIGSAGDCCQSASGHAGGLESLHRRAACAADRWGAKAAAVLGSRCRQPGMQRRDADLIQQGAGFGADVRRDGRDMRQPIGQRHEIKSRAADKDRQLA